MPLRIAPLAVSAATVSVLCQACSVVCHLYSSHCHVYSVVRHEWTPMWQHESTHVSHHSKPVSEVSACIPRCLPGLKSRCQSGVGSQVRLGSSPKDTGSGKNLRTAAPIGATVPQHVTSRAVVETRGFASIESADA